MTPTQLRDNALARLEDAQILCDNGRYDGAKYICGYAVELFLKARICDTLNWPSFPPTPNFFNSLKGLKTHDLDTLLLLTGREGAIKQSYFSAWSTVKTWKPEMRYEPVGHTTSAGANLFLQECRTLIAQL